MHDTSLKGLSLIVVLNTGEVASRERKINICEEQTGKIYQHKISIDSV